MSKLRNLGGRNVDGALFLQRSLNGFLPNGAVDQVDDPVNELVPGYSVVGPEQQIVGSVSHEVDELPSGEASRG